VEIDKTRETTVVVCTLPGCGDRGLVPSRLPGADSAWIRAHLARAHPAPSADRDRVVANLVERERDRRTRP
jgi:hypothetical protein